MNTLPYARNLERMQPFIYENPESELLGKQTHIYMWCNPRTTLDRLPFFMRMDLSGETWKYTWIGYDDMEHDYCDRHPGCSTRDVRLLIASHPRFKLIRPDRLPRVVMNHTMDAVPRGVWGNTRLLSPHGTVRFLIPDPGNLWRLVTRVRDLHGFATTGLTQDRVREIVRTQKWLTMVFGHRPPEPGEQVREYAHSRWETELAL